MEVVKLIRRYLEERGIKVCDVVSSDTMLIIFSNYPAESDEHTDYTEDDESIYDADKIISIVYHRGRLYVDRIAKGRDIEQFILSIPDPKLFDKLRKIML